jgi:hypothetical protein|tara:strand:+ start:4291 stop:5334 length:1044 start_codon:yes stop_codon:yes gene_type:complete
MNNNGYEASDSPQRSVKDWLPSTYDLRDTWFPVAHANHVSTRPIARIVHSQRCYLWRDNGVLFAGNFNPATKHPAAAVHSQFTDDRGFYPVAEYYGYVWVWYGNPSNMSLDLIPQIPFLHRDGSNIPGYMRTTVRFDSCCPLSVENLLDLTHADFLHGEVIGGEGEAESDVIETSYTSETLTRTRYVVGKPTSPVMRWVGGVRTQYQDFRSTLHVHLRSNLCISYPRFNPGFDVPNVQPFVPSGKYRSRVNQIFNLHAAPMPLRRVMPRMAYVVGPQDNSVMRPQTPAYRVDGGASDLHSRFDGPGARYRLLMKKLGERQQNGDYSYEGDADPGADIAQVLGMDRAI